MSFDGPPPFELMPLAEVPRSEWRGLPVFHPWAVENGNAYWRVEDAPEWMRSPDETKGTAYDVGVIYDWEPDPDFAQYGQFRVHFLGSDGLTLHYDSQFLWTPKISVFQRLGDAAEEDD